MGFKKKKNQTWEPPLGVIGKPYVYPRQTKRALDFERNNTNHFIGRRHDKNTIDRPLSVKYNASTI